MDKQRVLFVCVHNSARSQMAEAFLKKFAGRSLGLKPAEIVIGEGKNHKPQLIKNDSLPLFFNISHSGGWIMIAVSGNETGIDIEYINKALDYSEIAKQIYNIDELEFLNTRNYSLCNFYLLWTRKEALLKAIGIGVTDDIANIPSLSGVHNMKQNITGSSSDWKVGSFMVDNEHICSIGYNDHVENIHYFELPY